MSRSFLLEFLRFCLVILILSLGAGVLSFLYDAWNRNEFMLDRPLVVLVVGVDGHAKGTRGRSDSITLAFLDYRRHSLSLLAIPRDTYTEVPGAGTTRINASYAQGGIRLLTEAVERLLGRKIDRYIILDFGAFQKAVDLVGGVEITVDHDMDYEDHAQNLSIHIKKGPQRMDGETALEYARFRVERGGDIDRIRNQRKLLKALLDKLLDFHNLARLPGWYRALRPYLNTDVDPEDLYVFTSILSGTPESIQMKTLPGTFAPPYWRPDVVESRKLVEGYF